MSIFDRIIKRVLYLFNALLHFKSSVSNYRFFKDSIIIVYSPGKTGSSTIYYSLLKLLPFNQIYHVHFLSDEWIKKRIPAEKRAKYDRNIILAQKVYKALQKKDWKKVYYITCVRDPFSRGISAYFHNHNQETIKKKSKEELRTEIQNYVVDISLNWFQTDYCQYTGIPFSKINFNNKDGYLIMDNTKASYLILRTDKISSHFQKTFESLTKFKISELEQVNKRSKTRVGDYYMELKKHYYEDQEILEKKKTSAFVKKFFSPDEIKTFDEKYRKTS